MKSLITTLVFLIRDDEVLLAMKKRGFGVGRWNGVGGKLDAGETIEAALVRECQEEIGVTPKTYHKVAEHEFVEYQQTTPHRMLVHAYLCTKWDGQPAETEEMAPKWFKLHQLPYNDMWPDDIYWLPQVLEGKKVRSQFELNQADEIVHQSVEVVSSL